MIKPTKPMETYEDYGFKKCKGEYGKHGCYYLCVARGCKMIFLSKELLEIIPWEETDPRIHAQPNCRYSDQRTALDIVVELAIYGLLITKY